MTDPAFWRGKKVFLTGHTGFKGAWASLLLRRLGAEVYGYALAPTHASSLFVTARVADDIRHRIADIRDLATLRAAMAEAAPDIVIHMAAQALVRPSYEEPVETFATNVMGTVHVLEAARQLRTVRVILNVTSDKCYENNGAGTAFREGDRLGGDDPYSNSKACAELVTQSYRHSFYNAEGAARVATARAGNVFGGGDWARDRLVPDAMQAFLDGQALRLRNPNSVRPWQHALDPVLGYLTLVERLAGDARFIGGWNFGPEAASEVPVGTVVERLIALWGEGARWTADAGPHPHEAAYLKLDCTKARSELGWTPRLDLAQGLRLTVDWYKALREGRDLRTFSLDQLEQVVGAAQPV
ncbi:CDP-glucose 4,6-dehydratase [Bradyrhizobium sp. DASA03005]|uniref:CDP-glucose 4,6-dehydratase n=1 Tax=Bradyrhizobium TaxID=374 RepID=UPI00155F3320|nr:MULTISPECIES: CDP-glucose 4,6-dehydratase [Bradyrhizobium]MDD1518438.1 CDP-glucose 4,6-dehydratase [Bradyrhizobium sp. WBAH30]MDD1542236.1 CDP-glucose 4,6-dehydratase [Bradyrhizobium sp. WBAH41]MDD1556388.1 CDP-glucose 4,6-dehydratase [Bradyrhizobium sp. WBAH23]MDD1561771.1 CDP-glucose 4,6-dehydratase [Bradyrhizobium sp. WBAH33]MDD1589207.1 CDP-glucose 4,6-dehydratase [Bradyrhizobium sp. WBAH42]